jgi:hypothetical protein
MSFIPKASYSFLRLVLDKLRYLRELGVHFREPFPRSQLAIPPADSSHLIQAYSLYLTTTALRRNAVKTQNHGDVFAIAHELVSKALGMSLRFCEMVQPKGMEEYLKRIVRCEMAFVDIGGSLSVLTFTL